MHYEVMNVETGELNGHFRTLEQAKAHAEKLCNEMNRKEHFKVMKIEAVWVTSTLDEAIKNGLGVK